MELTPRQKEVLEVIITFINDHGYGPSVRELQDKLKIGSPNGIICHLTALSRKGIITREPGVARGIRLTATQLGLKAEPSPDGNVLITLSGIHLVVLERDAARQFADQVRDAASGGERP